MSDHKWLNVWLYVEYITEENRNDPCWENGRSSIAFGHNTLGQCFNGIRLEVVVFLYKNVELSLTC